ncbi:MAG: trigger factor [Candidatus Woesearchaeota archaeon]
MKYNKEKLKDNKVKIELTLTKEEWDEQIEKAYQEERKNYDIEGFRKGKAPRKVIEQKYGQGVFYEQAINLAFQKYYGEFLQKEKDFEPVGKPSLDIKKADSEGAIFTITTDEKPEVELGEYKNLDIETKPEEVKDEQVEAELKLEQDKASRMKGVDRAAKKGDTVNIDFTGKIDGEEFQGGKAQKYDLRLGSNSFIPGFEEKVEGLKKGDKKTIKVKFPDDYHVDKLKGKETEFDVKVNEVKEKELPELNDKFAEDYSEYKNLNEWREGIRKNLEEKAKKDADVKAENELIDKITNNAKVEAPESMVEEQLDAFIKQFEQQLQQQGMKLDDYLKMTGSSKEELRKSKREDAVQTVKTRLVLEAIMKKEKINVDDEEFNKHLEEMAKNQNMKLEELKKQLSQEHLNQFLNNLIVKKLLDFLKKNNNIK